MLVYQPVELKWYSCILSIVDLTDCVRSMSYHIENSSRMDKLKQSREMPNWAKRDCDADMAECPVSPCFCLTDLNTALRRK